MRVAIPDAPIAPGATARATLRVLMVHVGNPIDEHDPCTSRLQMRSLDTGDPSWYRKKDIINATDQMRSLNAVNVNVEYGFFSGRRSPATLLRAGLRIRRIARSQRAEVVHVLWGITAGLIAVIFAGCPVVISFCGSDLFGNVDRQGRRMLAGRASRLLSQLSALGARRIIVKSEKMRDVLWAATRHKSIVIPNGVDRDRFVPMAREEARARLGWSSSSQVMLFFPGEAAAVKNAPLAEAVTVRVQELMPSVTLLCVDNVAHDELVLYYNAADVMLLTSFHEGSNNSLKEAMCCNLPIVSVDCGDARERLGGVRNSFVVDQYDAGRLADAIVTVLERGERSDGRLYTDVLALDQIASRLRLVYEAAAGAR